MIEKSVFWDFLHSTENYILKDVVKMKIVGLEVIKVKPRWMFLRMHTDADITGLGEPVLEGHCNAVEAVIGESAKTRCKSNITSKPYTGADFIAAAL